MTAYDNQTEPKGIPIACSLALVALFAISIAGTFFDIIYFGGMLRPAYTTSQPAPSWTTPATVTRVIDGDTIEVEIRRTVRIRMLDCWAPESKIDGRLPAAEREAAKRAGLASKAHLTLLAQGQHVIVQIPTDPDGNFAQSLTLGRVLGHVWLNSPQGQNESHGPNGQTLAEKQVAAGFATKVRSTQEN